MGVRRTGRGYDVVRDEPVPPADIEAHWHIGHYVLPGNVQKVILKPKALPYAPEAPALSPY